MLWAAGHTQVDKQSARLVKDMKFAVHDKVVN